MTAIQSPAARVRPAPTGFIFLAIMSLGAGINYPVQKLLLAVVPRLAPNLRVGNGLDSNLISHDPATVKAYQSDRLVHDRVSGRLARFIAEAGAATVALAPRWHVPTLLMYAGSDRLVNPAGSRAFAARAPQSAVRAQCFESLYHEIFNELDAAPVFAALQNWLDANF